MYNTEIMNILYKMVSYGFSKYNRRGGVLLIKSDTRHERIDFLFDARAYM